jgi:ribosomal subunit interface protein
MSIEVTARHKDISARLQDYARGKAEAIEAEYPKTTSVKVVLDFDRHVYRTHVTATVNGFQFDGESDDTDNIVKTIDEAADKVDRQIRKQLDKIGDNRK